LGRFGDGLDFAIKNCGWSGGGSLEAKCLRIGDFQGDFLWCFRGEWMRNRGVLHGFCVVILQVEKHANFLNFIFCGDGALGG
jgi:hypothetical protein